jgi:hypothetical protein
MTSKNFFTFFFTHSRQVFNNAGIYSWVDVLRPSLHSVYPVQRSQNGLYLLVEEELPLGTLTVDAVDGLLYVDSSHEMTIDSITDTVDATAYPIDSYSFQIETPINPAAAIGIYNFPQQSYTFNFPFTIDNQRYLNPWWTEPIERDKLDPRSDLVLETLTTDSIEFQTNSTEYEQFIGVPIEGTTDAEYRYLVKEVDPNIRDRHFCELPYTSVNIENIPQAELRITLEVSNSIRSEIYRKRPGRGYLPSAFLGEEMPGATLEQVAAGLLALVAQDEDELIYLVLQELIYIWGTLMGNLDQVDGVLSIRPEGLGVLPDYVWRSEFFDYSQTDLQRTTAQVAWLGIGVSEAVRHLRDRPKQFVQDLPTGIDLFLRHHAYHVASLVDPASGWPLSGFDALGVSLDTSDYEALMLSCVFLHSSLSIQYESFIHERAAITYLAAKAVIGVPESEVLASENTPKPVAYLARLIWSLFYKNTDGLNEVVEIYTSLVLADGQIPYNIPAFLYVVSQFSASDLGWTDSYKELWQLDRFYEQTSQGLYKSIRPGMESQSLYVSAWSLMADNELQIFKGARFSLYAEEAWAFVSYCYFNAKRVWPFGYRWNGQSFERARIGAIGSILYAQAWGMFSWYLQHALFRDGRQLSEAQGWATDLWAKSLGRERPLLQSDRYLLPFLQTLLEGSVCTLAAVKDRLEKLYVPEGFDLIEPSEFPRVYFLQGTSYSSRTWTGSYQDFNEVIEAQDHPISNGEPGFLQASSSTVTGFIPWSEVCPKLELKAWGRHPDLNKEVQGLAPLAVGLKTTLYLIFNNEEVNDHCVGVFDSLLDYCILALRNPKELLIVGTSFLGVSGCDEFFHCDQAIVDEEENRILTDDGFCIGFND